jgi:hypothetical protein
MRQAGVGKEGGNLGSRKAGSMVSCCTFAPPEVKHELFSLCA